MMKHYDPGAIVVIGITLILFVTALFLKGFSHEMMQETGVFLVSVKLILMGYKSSVRALKTEDRLDQILALLRSMADRPHT
jgi:NADH:ubiquinone oxidoreductase subunit H